MEYLKRVTAVFDLTYLYVSEAELQGYFEALSRVSALRLPVVLLRCADSVVPPESHEFKHAAHALGALTAARGSFDGTLIMLPETVAEHLEGTLMGLDTSPGPTLAYRPLLKVGNECPSTPA